MRLQMRTVLIHTAPVNAVPAVFGRVLDPAFVSLGALPPGSAARVVSVGSGGTLTPLERRLIEFGFVHGEQVEVLAEARPGRDPFVVRVGHTTLALRRREAENVLVELHHTRVAAKALPHPAPAAVGEPVELQR
jgi:ferrous iron transport protein A